uniref:Uncharacterized protein n=1 Tax=Glossina brevipalpis TaxID=37001 RepID=A0A1A9X066_9MUSC
MRNVKVEDNELVMLLLCLTLRAFYAEISVIAYHLRPPSCGSSGSALASKTCNDNKTVRKLIEAAQLSFKMSKQMAPVADDIFGCQILVTNRIFGGLKGYVSGTLISSINVPPSYGVSGGPTI